MSDYQIYRLPCGIRCLYHQTQSKVAYVSLTIGAGTRDEQPSQHGVAHLVEHLLFKGTPSRTAYRIGSVLESVGGDLNAFTSKEETVVHASVPVEYTSRAAELLADIVFNSLFDPIEIDKEREVIIDEINSYKDSPSELIFDDFEELIFSGSALGRNILGSKHNLKSIDRSDLLNFKQRNYRPQEMVFAVSSSLSFARFMVLCNRVFSSVVATQFEPIERSTPLRLERFDVLRNKKLHQSHVLLGGYAYSAYDARRLELAFLLNILGGPTSISKLNQLLRERHAMTYTVEASFSTFADTGLWTIYFSSENQKREKAISLIEKELLVLCEVELSPRTLAACKRQFIGQLTMGTENRENTIIAIAKSILLYDEFESNEVIIDKINAITSSSLLEVSQDIFAPSNISKLIYV